MFSRSNLNSVPPEVAAVMRELNKEEAISKRNQTRLGKRVPFDEKKIACEPFYTTLSGQRVDLEGPFTYLTFSEPAVVNSKEPTLYKIAKNDEVGVRVREAS